MLLLVWFLGSKRIGVGVVRRIRERYLLVVTATLWLFMILAVAFFVTSFDYFADSHDIDDAVDAAVVNWTSGTNPYVESVVPRFSEMGHFSLLGAFGDEEPTWSSGTYNYLPLDLLIYSGAHAVLGGLGNPVWFAVINIIFCSVALAIFHRLVPAVWFLYLPIAVMVTVFYSFDNTSLTILLMVLALYARERSRVMPEELSILLLGLATLTKIFAALPLLVILLYDLQKHLMARDIARLARTSASAAVILVIAVAVIVPFGYSEVLDSTVFVYSSGTTRDDMPMGGTLLSEIAVDSDLFSVISIASVTIALLMGFWMSRPYDRILLVLVAFLLVSVKTTLAPFAVGWIFLALRLRPPRMYPPGHVIEGAKPDEKGPATPSRSS